MTGTRPQLTAIPNNTRNTLDSRARISVAAWRPKNGRRDSRTLRMLYPAPVTTDDGRTMVFRPKDPDPHEVLQALSDRIRALPDALANLDGPNG